MPAGNHKRNAASVLMRNAKEQYEKLKHSTSLNKRFACMIITVAMFTLTLTFLPSFTIEIFSEVFRDRLPPMVSESALYYFFNGAIWEASIVIILLILMMIGLIIVAIMNLRNTAKQNRRFKGRLSTFQKAWTRALLYITMFIILLGVGIGSLGTLTCIDNININEQLTAFKLAGQTPDAREKQVIAASVVRFRNYDPAVVSTSSGMLVFSNTSVMMYTVTEFKQMRNEMKILKMNGNVVSESELDQMVKHGYVTPKKMSADGKYMFDTDVWLSGPHYQVMGSVAPVPVMMDMSYIVSDAAAGEAMVYLMNVFKTPIKQMMITNITSAYALDYNKIKEAVTSCHITNTYFQIVEGAFMIIFIAIIIMIAIGFMVKSKPTSYDTQLYDKLETQFEQQRLNNRFDATYENSRMAATPVIASDKWTTTVGKPDYEDEFDQYDDENV